MIVVVFRTRMRNDADLAEAESMGLRLYELASAMPGFVSYKEFAAEDGECVAVVEFESLETLAAWRDHPEHRKAQERGRDAYFASYHIQICSIVREYSFP